MTAIRKGAGSQSVQGRVLVAKVLYQRAMAQGPAGTAAAQLGGAPALAGTMDLLVEPALEAGELAAAQVVLQVEEVKASGQHQLGGVEVAERIRRKIAEPAEAPVDVLQASLRVGLDLQPEELPNLLVPRDGQIGDG